MATWCEHCFVTTIQFLKNPKYPPLYKNTAPLKNFIKIGKTSRQKKAPPASTSGAKMATIHRGEANEQSEFGRRPKSPLRTRRKEVYTLANEEATEKDSYAC